MAVLRGDEIDPEVIRRFDPGELVSQRTLADRQLNEFYENEWPRDLPTVSLEEGVTLPSNLMGLRPDEDLEPWQRPIRHAAAAARQPVVLPGGKVPTSVYSRAFETVHKLGNRMAAEDLVRQQYGQGYLDTMKKVEEILMEEDKIERAQEAARGRRVAEEARRGNEAYRQVAQRMERLRARTAPIAATSRDVGKRVVDVAGRTGPALGPLAAAAGAGIELAPVGMAAGLLGLGAYQELSGQNWQPDTTGFAAGQIQPGAPPGVRQQMPLPGYGPQAVTTPDWATVAQAATQGFDPEALARIIESMQ